MDALARLEERLNQLLAEHGRWRNMARELEIRLQEQVRQARRGEERLSQALRRIQELERERGHLRDQVSALPDQATLDEARRRLQRILDQLDD